MERLHLHIQQLQLELADVREKNGSNLDDSNLKDASEFEQSKSSQIGDDPPSANGGNIQTGNSESAPGGNTLSQVEYAIWPAFFFLRILMLV